MVVKNQSLYVTGALHWFTSHFTENFGRPVTSLPLTSGVVKPAFVEHQTVLLSPTIWLIIVKLRVRWFSRFRQPRPLLGGIRSLNVHVTGVLFNRCSLGVICHQRETSAHRLTLGAAISHWFYIMDHPVTRPMVQWPTSWACLYKNIF